MRGRVGCERRSETFVKIQKQNWGGGESGQGRGSGQGGSRWGGGSRWMCTEK